MKTRNERKRDRVESIARVAFGIIVIAVLIGILAAFADEPEPTPTQERYAAFAAQERYYDVLERYGDKEGAVEAAKLVWEDLR